MANSSNEIRPVLKPMKLPPEAEGDYALWFVESDITNTTDEAAIGDDKATTRSKLKSWFKDNLPNAGFGNSGDLKVVPIMMGQDDLDKHFATDDETLEYLHNVQEPSGGRLAWLKERYREQEPKARKIREVTGMATKAHHAYNPAGSVMGSLAMTGAAGGGGA